MSNACVDLMPVVDQISIDLTALEAPHFEKLDTYCKQPKNLAAVVDLISTEMEQTFSMRLFYEKLKHQTFEKKQNAFQVINQDYWENLPLNMPGLYLKVAGESGIKLASEACQKKVTGLVIKSGSVKEASALFSTARSLKNLKNVDLQAEVPITTLEEAHQLKAVGYSEVQIPGQLLLENVSEVHPGTLLVKIAVNRLN